MCTLPDLFDRNRAWADRVTAADPRFFQRLSRQQSPRYMWIGCADSRVPANEIVGLGPGELFVHRNIANLVPPFDANVHSVLQFAVEALKVKHIIVCGHYGCGGVLAALREWSVLPLENWLAHVRAVYRALGLTHPTPIPRFLAIIPWTIQALPLAYTVSDLPARHSTDKNNSEGFKLFKSFQPS